MKKFIFILVAGSLLVGCGTSRSSLFISAHAEKPRSFLGCSPEYDVHLTYKLVTANRK